MTQPRKKLIEVSLPLEAINRESAREKSIRHGHPSTLHLWWARRPLAACRAVIFSQLVDDPSSVPEEFPTIETQKAERERLHRLIERLVPWEASTNETILNEARYEIARSVARGLGEKPPLKDMTPKDVIAYLQDKAPPVYDPFSGGGSIPLEAQRLGLRAMGSDLNPVAVLIGKALVEFPPKFANLPPVNPEADKLRHYKGAEGLAEDVRHYGRWMREEAKERIGHLYPQVTLPDGSKATVIAWLWARTVPSPDPRAKGVPVPLASSFILSSKAGKEAIVVPVVDRTANTWTFEVKTKPSAAELTAAKNGTKAARGGNFVCLLTGAAITETFVKSEATNGRMGAKLMAIVAEGERGRAYVTPVQLHEELPLNLVKPEAPEIDQPIAENPRDFRTRLYGMPSYRDLFTARQLVALTTFSDLVSEARERALADAQIAMTGDRATDLRPLAEGGLGPIAYADAVATYLGMCVSRQANRSATLTFWDTGGENVQQVFARQALPMTWDYCESNPLSDASGSFISQLNYLPEAVARTPACSNGSIENRNAALNHFQPGTVFSTDPPYYDNIGYADLSDFFYVWLRRSLGSSHDRQGIWPDLFRRVITPKSDELVATPYRHGGKEGAEKFFMDGMRVALTGIANTTTDQPVTIYYAFKQSDSSDDGVTSAGWATFLQAVADCGLSIDGTWPMRTELSGNLKKSVNALASSIVLVCRRRDAQAGTVMRSDFLRALRREMPDALHNIRAAGVGPTDIQQAAIGPGIGVFTRYAQVLNPDGSAMLVKDALKLINQVREEIASDLDADYDPETRFALDWFAAHGFGQGKSGDAINMTNAVNISLDGVAKAGFFFAQGGVARLLKRDELPGKYDPVEDATPTVWEACQHLIKRLEAEDGGVDAAAALYAKLGTHAEPAQALARRLYDICEQKGWASEGYAYNRLFQDWEAIRARAEELGTSDADLFG